MSAGVLLPTYLPPLRIVDSADFDGINDQMARGSALSGAVGGKSGSLSAWVRLDAAPAFGCIFSAANGTAPRFEVIWASADKTLRVTGNNAAGASILDIRTTTARNPGAAWVHLLASWDLAVPGSARVFLDDVSDLTQITFTNDTIQYNAPTNFFIGTSAVLGSGFWNGCIAEPWLDFNTYIDFNLVYWRRKFRSASGKPVHLGNNGELVTGNTPIIYQHLDDGESVANFAINRGTGGNFTISGGGLGIGSSTPSD